jgi:enediyne biosynthesis protein E4
MKKGTHPLLVLLFLALLGAPAIYHRASGPAPVDGDALGRHGFALAESAAAAGLKFKHASAMLDAKLAHIMPQVAALGAGLAVGDFDRDGWIDVYVTNSAEGSQNALFRNRGDGTFEDVAARMGVADLNRKGQGCSTGAIWGDVDGDGFEDLLVYKYGPPELYRNQAGKGFQRIAKPGLPTWVNANSAVWLDYDRDGKLDLFLAGYFDERLDLWDLKTTRMMPDSFEYATNGGRKYLLRGKGDGTFEDVTQAMGIDSRRWALAVTSADFFNTGYPDLFIANDYGVSELWQNQAGKGFRDVGRDVGVARAPKSGMNAACGDVFNQGRLAVYVSNISEEGVLIQGNNLWVPRLAKGQLTFENLARVTGVELGGWSFGAQFGDLDNDGAMDLYLVNGYVSADPKQSYWYDFSKVAGGHGSIINDAANWPPMNGRSLSGYQAKKVWKNDGTGHFTEVAQQVGVTDRYDGRAVVLADFGNRGVLDALVANQNGPLLYYRNTVKPGGKWLQLRLAGQASNRTAIGSKVTVSWAGKTQVQEVHGGSGFASQSDRRLHFGLGANPGAVSVSIRWPSGKVQELKDVALDRLHEVKEP